MKISRLNLILLLSLCCEVTFAGYVTVIGSRTIKHKSAFEVALTSTGYNNNEECEVSLIGAKNGEEIDTQTIRLGQESQSLTFNLKDVSIIQDYELSMKIQSEDFEQRTKIMTLRKRYSVFIQTDKPVYKLGQQVKFSILVIDSESKPYQAKKMRVEMIDGLGEPSKIIENSDKKKLRYGLFTGTVEIPRTSQVGAWHLRAIINDEEELATEYSLEIIESASSPFEVFVDTKHDVTHYEGEVKMKISAKYPSDVNVIGTAVIVGRVYDPDFPKVVQQTARKTVTVRGLTKVKFDLKKDLVIHNQIRPWDVIFDVTFRETKTGQEKILKVPVRVFTHAEYSVELVREQKRFKPGYPYKLKAIVRNADGTMASSEHEEVKVELHYFLKPLLCTPRGEASSLTETLDSSRSRKLVNGVADLTFNVPANTTGIMIETSYFDTKADLNIVREDSNSREYLHGKVLTQTPKVGGKIRIEVEGNKDWEGVENFELFSVVVGRTGILHQTVHKDLTEKEDDKVVIEFEFGATAEMAPVSHLIVYYFQALGEIVYDRIKLEIGSANELTINVPKANQKPGNQVDFNIQASPNSIAILLAVDQSLAVTSSDHDISNMQIGDSLFENKTPYKVVGNEKRYLDFGDSNAFILTNAVTGNNTCFSMGDFKKSRRVIRDDDDRVEESEDFQAPKLPKTKKDLAATWFFETFEVGSNGKISFSGNLPETQSSYLVTGFAIRPDNGISIAVPKQIIVA